MECVRTSAGPPDGSALGHELSLAVVMFHEQVARTLGVSASEHKVLDMLSRGGQLTPGEIARQTRLSGAAVTKIIDNLVSLHYVERAPHSTDRRSVRLLLTEEYRRASWPATAGLAERVLAGNEAFDDDELAAINRWLVGVIEALRDETRKLSTSEGPGGSRS